MKTNLAPKLLPMRCNQCDEIIIKEWKYCPYCSFSIPEPVSLKTWRWKADELGAMTGAWQVRDK